jgi:hypothetical protein
MCVADVKGSAITVGPCPVLELPGGLNPQLFAQPPQTRCPGIPRGGGGQFQPPAVVNDAELPVCNDNV